MKLRRLSIDRLAGIGAGFEIRDLDCGLNVVLGPNASGKSSLLRAVRALLFLEASSGPVSLEAEFDDARGTLRVVRQGSEVHWIRDGEPVDPPELPDERLVSCFTIHLEQLLSSGETEAELRERVSRILAGGYDLDSVRGAKPFSTPPRHGRNEERELRSAERDRAQALEVLRTIRDEEQELDALRRRKELASRSRALKATLETALHLLAARRRVASLEGTLSDFPAGMDKLAGDESGRLEKLRLAQAKHTKALERARDDAIAANDELNASALADSDLTIAALDGHDKTLEAQRQAEQEWTVVASALEQAEARLAGTVRELGGREPAASVRIDPEIVRRAELGLGAKRKLTAEIRALDEQIALLRPTETDDATLDRTRDARNELSRWLATPPAAEAEGRSGRPWVLLLAAVALAGVASSALLVHWAIALLGIAVIAICVPLLRRREVPDVRRPEVRRRFAETGAVEPAAWEHDEVRARMEELESEVIAAEHSRLDAERRRDLQARREDLRSREAEIEIGLRDLANEVGFDPDRLDGSFDRWLRLVQEYDEARRRVSDLTGERRALSQRVERHRRDLLEFLGRFIESPEEQSSGADILSGRLNNLRERIRRRDDARRDLERADVTRREAEAEMASAKDEIAALFARAELEPNDESSLVARLDRRDEWKRAIDALREERAVERDTAQRLGAEPALVSLVEQDDETTLHGRLEEATTLADEHEELARRILSIENRIENAKSGHDLEEARALVANRLEALQDRLGEEMFAAAAEYLLDEAEQEHVAVSRPPVLRRAEEWFARFTNHAFSLRAPSGRNGTFLARDTSAACDRTLEQLSSGTRMQLLLALRLSFALEAERGREPLPIFLDEALTVADPERFRRVVECVHEFSRDQDRQIFYLTAQPHDLAVWSSGGVEPNRIRLDEVRRLAAAVPRASELEVPPLEEIPESAGRTAVEYGLALRVPRIALWDGPEAVHLFHLLRDDLSLLERLLRREIRTVGQLRSLLGSGAARVLLTQEQIEDLHLRTGAVETFLDACRRGRGRPVDREILERAGVTDLFVPRLALLVEELNGDGHALLRAIGERRDERVKNFRTKQSEQLRNYLEEHGHIDERPSLELQEIELLILASLSPGIDSGSISIETITELTRSLAATAIPETAE